MFCLLLNETEYVTWQFRLCNDLCLLCLNFSKMTMHLQGLYDNSEFVFTLWYSDIQRHVFYYPNRWGINLYVSIFFLFKEHRTYVVFHWDRGLLFSCCWWCFITGSWISTNYLLHFLWVDTGLLTIITHPKDPHGETLQGPFHNTTNIPQDALQMPSPTW